VATTAERFFRRAERTGSTAGGTRAATGCGDADLPKRWVWP